ncbi:unnamed protein product [Phyllotreta striolata]|uniref:SESTD1-like spectrin repeats region domain-containing protein n=1 Tax=Phyllotreta striolata TaxID=444603 RepID=A0A9N9TW15_PHYSR|nr:unnamed protein product [Phyllotreta striolata]
MDVSCLQGRSATVPGGRDKEGKPLIVITVPSDSPHIDVVPAFRYLLSLFSKTSRSRGLTVIVDARKGPWKVARSCIRQAIDAFSPEEPAEILVLRPDAFWDKQRVDNCASASNDKQVTFVPRSRLNKFADPSQLPVELGGSFVYDHDKWIENRQKVEEFYLDCDVALKELDELHRYVMASKMLRPSQVQEAISTGSDMAQSTKMLVFNATQTGKEIIENIEYENRTRKFASEHFDLSTPQDALDTIKKIDEIINDIKTKQQEIEEAWIQMEKVYVDTKDLGCLEDGIVKVINWILGPAEALLNAHQKVGYDVASAEELRAEHEAIELECWETYGAYAELVHRINALPDAHTLQHKDLVSQKDFMDFVCKSFAMRLERRRNLLITSLRFYRLVSEYFDRTSEVFDRLVMGIKVTESDKAGDILRQLEENQANLDLVERELRKEGDKLSDMLSMSVKDCLGRDIPVDRGEDIVNVRDVLDATTARRNIFVDSVEAQKLALERARLAAGHERDAAQAVRWLDELLEVMLRHHGHVGCAEREIQRQKDEHADFQETAKGTYDYGCQLLSAASALRRSCKLPVEEHAGLCQKLENSWGRLQGVSQEQMTRLRVSAVFHRSVEEQCNQLRDLREAVATIPLMEVGKKKMRVDYYFTKRERLIVEVGRMVRLGRMLRNRLKEPLCYGEKFLCSSEETEEPIDSIAKNEIAVEAITERLCEITLLAEELDFALQSAEQDCLAFSSTSTSTSSSASPDNDKQQEDMEHQIPPKREDLKSDEEFLTASESTLQHSRSSSYNTASECEHLVHSPWWEHSKDDLHKDLNKQKMVLAVGLPDLPPPKEVLKPSPEVPPGKVVREVIETTHLKVQQSHTLGVASFVLSSETVGEGAAKLDEEELERRLKEVGRCEEEAWKAYHNVTKQAIKGFL